MCVNSGKWAVFNRCDSPVAFKSFNIRNCGSAKLSICGLGFFECFINGKRVSDDLFVPAQSDYEKRENMNLLYPLNETFSHRIYYMVYDVSHLISEGENKIEVHLGNGWYNQKERTVEGTLSYGSPKLWFELELAENGERRFVVSDEELRWKKSHITFNNLFFGETHDFTIDTSQVFECEFCAAPEAELLEQDCPTDKIIRTIKPHLLGEVGGKLIYDAGENISGFVRCVCQGEVTLRFGDELFCDGSINFFHCGGDDQIQTDRCITDGEKRFFEPKFVWHAFRYFELSGNAEDIEVCVVHADVKNISGFESDNATLNWIYDAFIRTQYDNMHCGVVSDCPHRERLGYTGDGQVVSNSAMLLLDSKTYYKKWIEDICDCQNIENGHVQHTAPFNGGGGGPGGWGGAIVIVPYFYYKHFGETDYIKEKIPYMQKWCDYMDSRSEDGIVVREEKDGWCLGEWACDGGTKISESYVNTYFYIRALGMIAEMKEAVGEASDGLKEKIETLKKALCDKFYDKKTNSFADGVNGANLFAIDIGLGNEEMIKSVIEHYESLGEFDTGIFGTEILIRVLFEKGYENIAFKLLTSEKKCSFYNMKKQGATTLWESWDGTSSRNHPMFGGCVCQLFYGILGTGKDKLSPKIPDGLNMVSGFVGDESVKYIRGVGFEVIVPTEKSFEYKGISVLLKANEINYIKTEE